MIIKRMIVVVVSMLLSQLTKAQIDTAAHTLKFKHSFITGFTKFYINDKKISHRQIKQLLKENPASGNLFQKSKRLKTQGIIFYSVSAVMVTSVAIKILTYEVGDAVVSGILGTQPGHYKPTSFETTVLAGGFGLMGFSAVQYIRGKSAFKKAISAYNNSYGTKQKVSVNIGVTNTGNIGLTLNF